MKILIIIWATLVVFSCESVKTTASENQNTSKNEGKEIAVKYAKGFKIFDYGTYMLVKTYRNGEVDKELKLHRKSSAELPSTEITIPIKSIICTSTTHLPALEMLGVGNSLIGFPGTKYISSSFFNSRLSTGQIVDLGVDNQLNIETIASLQPDIVVAYTMGNESKQWSKLAELQIPLTFNSDYLEESVLGRAEWIKFMASFFDKNREADSIFTMIENDYYALQQLTKNVAERPTVLSGIMYGDAWYMPGGKNWGSSLLQDAGGSYLWANDSSSGWIEAGFENVMEKGQNADYWIGLASISSLQNLEEADSRYTYFKPFKSKKAYNYTAKIGPGGGYEIMELGYAKPQLVLADMIKILHPELLLDYDLYFYEELK